MNLKNTTKLENNMVELEIEVSAEEFEKAVEAAYRKNIGKMNIHGFRKGKAPRKFVEKMYGEGVFYEDAVNATYPDAYEQAVEIAKIEPIDKADIEVLNMGKEGYTFKAKVAVKPEVELGIYKGIQVEKTAVHVSDEDIENELKNVQRKYARLISVEDRAAALEDNVVIDYEGFVDGVPFEGGKGENHNLKLGSGQFIPGFEEQLVGKNIGDDVEVSVTFPEEYHSEELKGKAAIFKVKIHEIKVNELPEMDDELAKDASEFDTLVEFKDSLKEKLVAAREKQSETEVETKILDAIIADMKADIPAVMIERQLDNIVNDYSQRMSQQGMALADYLQYTGSSIDVFKDNFRAQAEIQVKTRLALEKVVELENIVIAEEEIEEEFKKFADDYKMEVEKIKMYIPAAEIAKDLAVTKAIELVKNNAEVTVVVGEEKPAKKAAAKKTKAKSETKE
jgi:trigger factor